MVNVQGPSFLKVIELKIKKINGLLWGVPYGLDCVFSKISKKQSISYKYYKHKAFLQYAYDNVPSKLEYR
jgi:hypothetical protein